MHSYSSSATAMFVCIWSVCAWACVCVCLSGLRWCVYLFMSSIGVFVCTVPLLPRKIRRHLLGGSELAVKKQERKVWKEGGGGERGREGGRKKNLGSPEIYLLWLPASLKLPVGDFKMAPPLPATEWALPCQNVFDWKIQTEKFPLFPLPLILIVFLALPRASPLPSSVHPSSHTERAAHSLQWSSHWMPPLLRQREAKEHSLPPLPSLSLPRSLSLELCQSSLSRWGICQSVRSPFLTKTWCLSPVSCR